MHRRAKYAFVLLIAGETAAAADEIKMPPPAQAAVRRGLGYLANEGVQWMEVRKCASCHHVPFMIWALHEAKNLGYAVDAKALADVTTWVLAKDDPGKVFVKATPKKDAPPPPKDVSQAPLNLALAFGAIREPDAAQRSGIARFLERIRAEQNDNGSWHLTEGNRRPPMMANPDVMTRWALLALTHTPAADQAAAAPRRDLAQKWLESAAPNDSHEAPIVQLLVQKRQGKSAKELETIAKKLLDAQSADGGWRQTKEMTSDAYATGQTLYALTEAGVSPQAAPLQKAVEFLIKTQRADGSWPMTSRPRKPGDAGCKNTDPITYVGTAWATIALAHLAPVGTSVNPLAGKRFLSVEKLPGGETAKGEVRQIHWVITFKDNSYEWLRYDVIVPGNYAIDMNTGVLTVPKVEASFDAKSGVLTWDKRNYTIQKSPK